MSKHTPCPTCGCALYQDTGLCAGTQLLEACKALMSKVSRIPSENLRIEDAMSDISPELASMDAAIAKAEHA